MSDNSERPDIWVLICTRNRPELVSDQLEYLWTQLEFIGRVVIVDSSSKNDTKDVIEHQAAAFGERLVYLRSKSGAPRQKNVAMDYVACSQLRPQFVCFLDDDVIPGPAYFKSIRRLFDDNPRVECLGGFDSALPEQPYLRFFEILGLTGSGTKNEILWTGICTLVRPKKDLQVADWVPGGMQSYRWPTIQNHRFDGRFRIHGDEVEFQTRVLRNEQIFVSRLLDVRHRSAQSGKATVSKETMFMDGFRWRLSKLHPKVSRSGVLFSSAALCLGEALLALLRLDAVRLRRSGGHASFLLRTALRIPTDDVVPDL